MVEKRFRVLRLVAFVCRIIAWITLVGGILGMLATIVTFIVGGPITRQMAPGTDWQAMFGIVGGIIAGVSILLIAALYFVFLYALSEAIHLLLSIEENTREAAYMLSQERES